jgi:hypothetical protein
MQSLKPWLNSDYLKKACLEGQGRFRLLFLDGVEKVYHISDCQEAQIKDAVELLKKNKVPVEKI